MIRMSCTKDQALSYVKEVRDILAELPQPMTFMERKKKIDRLNYIRTELKIFRRENPDA